MITLFFQALIIAFAVQFIWFTMTTGEIFESIGDFLDRNISSDKLKKPIFSCPICMTPYYGSAIYFACMFSIDHVFIWQHFVIVILCATGLNVMITKANSFHTKGTEFFDDADEDFEDDDDDDQYPVADFPITPRAHSPYKNQFAEHGY